MILFPKYKLFWKINSILKCPSNYWSVLSLLSRILDWVTIKTYDFYGHWSKFTGEHTALYASSKEPHDWEKKHLNVDAVTKNWIEAGLSKKKLVISVAFYGRTFKLKDKTKNDIHSPVIGAGPGDGILDYSEVNIFLWTNEVIHLEKQDYFDYDPFDVM